MVRERVGDPRLSWRFALAGLAAAALVMATAQTAVIAPLFYALQDQLFPAPAPSPQVTLVALDSASGVPFGLQYTALGDTINTGARFCAAAPPLTCLIGWPTHQACADYIAVDEMPGLQLKGKSAEKFRVLRITAIRQGTDGPWVPFPADDTAPACV